MALTALGATEQSLHDGNMKTYRSSDPLSGRVTNISAEQVATNDWINQIQLKWRTDSALHERADLGDAATPGDDTFERFDYDDLGRLDQALTSATSGGTGVRTLAYDYDYDAHGNLTTKTSDVAGDPDATGYAYSATGKSATLPP